MLMMLLITIGQMLCESWFHATHSTEVILANPLKVVLLSPPDKETSLERLSNFSKAFQLEMTEPEMGLYPPKPVLLILTLECPSQEGKGEGVCFQREQSPHRRSHFPFPRDPVCRTESVPGEDSCTCCCALELRASCLSGRYNSSGSLGLSRETPVPSGSVC